MLLLIAGLLILGLLIVAIARMAAGSRRRLAVAVVTCAALIGIGIKVFYAREQSRHCSAYAAGVLEAKESPGGARSLPPAAPDCDVDPAIAAADEAADRRSAAREEAQKIVQCKAQARMKRIRYEGRQYAFIPELSAIQISALLSSLPSGAPKTPKWEPPSDWAGLQIFALPGAAPGGWWQIWEFDFDEDRLTSPGIRPPLLAWRIDCPEVLPN